MTLRRLMPLALCGLNLVACGGDAPAPQSPSAPSAPPLASVTSPPAVAVATPVEAPKVAPKASYPASTPGNEFAMSMLRALHDEKGNLFFSGESLRGALGLTALGAKGQTLTEMTQTLHLDLDPAKNAANEKAELAA